MGGARHRVGGGRTVDRETGGGLSLPVWIGFAAFFVIRGSILHWKFGAAPMELMNNPFLKIEGAQWVAFTFGEKLATILYTLGKYLVLLVFPHLPLPRIIAADIAYAVPLTLVAGMGHASLGSVDWALLAQLLAGSLPGIWLGSRLVSRTPERLIRSALSVLLAWAGAKLVLI